MMVYAYTFLQAVSILIVFPIQAARYKLCMVLVFYSQWCLVYFIHSQVAIIIGTYGEKIFLEKGIFQWPKF
jgi:hypothetical protein